MSSKNYKSAFALLVMLFIMWGFITSLNDILIPHLKGLFDLSYTEAMLVQFCFFGAYFVMSIPASRLIERVGYQHGIVAGLSIMGVGALGFLPASIVVSYPLFLLSLFILASGITILQVAANPYVAVAGNPKTASSRLNLAQGFNSLAHTVAPIVGASLILAEGEAPQASSVQLPYMTLAAVIFALAAMFYFIKLPKVIQEKANVEPSGILKYPHLLLGVLAIFLYVGAEVSIGGFLVNFFSEQSIAGFTEKEAGNYVAFYWGGAMVGRFVGSAVLQEVKAQKLLAVNAIGAMLLVAVTVMATGEIAMWSIILVGFFNSIMFANIFTLSIDGLGKYTSLGSGLLVAAIVGGAIIPLLQGVVADSFGVQNSFAITLVCYAYILYYALVGYRMKYNS